MLIYCKKDSLILPICIHLILPCQFGPVHIGSSTPLSRKGSRNIMSENFWGKENLLHSGYIADLCLRNLRRGVSQE